MLMRVAHKLYKTSKKKWMKAQRAFYVVNLFVGRESAMKW